MKVIPEGYQLRCRKCGRFQHAHLDEEGKPIAPGWKATPSSVVCPGCLYRKDDGGETRPFESDMMTKPEAPKRDDLRGRVQRTFDFPDDQDVETISEDLDRLKNALRESGTDQGDIAERGLSLVATLLRKNTDYGSSVFKPPALCPDMGTDAAILVRMGDKIGRIQRLMKEGKGEVDESLMDTMGDLAGYAILWMVHHAKT